MQAERQPHSEIVVLTLLLSRRRRQRGFTRDCPRSLIWTTIIIVVPAFPEDRHGLCRLYLNVLRCMALHRVSDDQITMIQSQSLPRRSSSSWGDSLDLEAFINSARLSIESEFICCDSACEFLFGELISNLNLAKILLPIIWAIKLA